MIKIYKITNKINNYVYIGQTSNSLELRFKGHVKNSFSKDKSRSKSLLHEDILKYGEENFTIEEIDTCEDRHKFIIEKHWIEEFERLGYPMYNVINSSNQLNSQQKQSQRRLNNNFDYQSDDFKYTMSKVTSGENNGMYGKTLDKAVNGQSVYCYDDDYNLVKEFVSVRHCLNYYGLKGHVSLNNACKNGTKWKGYYWTKEWKNFNK